jgi:hypothetical protein|tara:strand:+ start:603 stop:887 length:285 start_codon:yes stop_codon:yes gene_type:complete
MAKYREDSQYRNTTVKDKKYLDVWNPDAADLLDYDVKIITIESKYHQKPDKLAHDLYGNSKLWWIFAQFNQDTLKDPILDFTSGKSIVIPDRYT